MHTIAVWFQDVLVPWLGAPGIFVAAFLDATVLSLPEVNDLLVVTSAAKHPEWAWLYALAATLGSVSGCAILWWVGWRGEEAFLEKRFGVHRVARARAAFHKWDFLALAIPSLLPPPMPFKIFVLAAGVFEFPLGRSIVTLLVARILRFGACAYIGVHYGDRAIDVFKTLDAWVSARLPWLLAVALLAGLGWLSWRRLRRRAAA